LDEYLGFVWTKATIRVRGKSLHRQVKHPTGHHRSRDLIKLIVLFVRLAKVYFEDRSQLTVC
jgi:hypothetical protein